MIRNTTARTVILRKDPNFKMFFNRFLGRGRALCHYYHLGDIYEEVFEVKDIKIEGINKIDLKLKK